MTELDRNPDARPSTGSPARHGVSPEAVEHCAGRRWLPGRGPWRSSITPSLAAMGQWTMGGMTMIGDMFNNSLKARVDAICTDVAELMPPVFARVYASAFSSQTQCQGGPFKPVRLGPAHPAKIVRKIRPATGLAPAILVMPRLDRCPETACAMPGLPQAQRWAIRFPVTARSGSTIPAITGLAASRSSNRATSR